MYRVTNAFNIRLVVPGISMFMLIALVVLAHMGWYRRGRKAIDRSLWNEEHIAWLLIGLLMLSIFGFGVLTGYVLIRAWW